MIYKKQKGRQIMVNKTDRVYSCCCRTASVLFVCISVCLETVTAISYDVKRAYVTVKRCPPWWTVVMTCIHFQWFSSQNLFSISIKPVFSKKYSKKHYFILVVIKTKIKRVEFWDTWPAVKVLYILKYLTSEHLFMWNKVQYAKIIINHFCQILGERAF